MSMDKPNVIPRNHRVRALDILRGYFLIVILINHIELYPSGFDFLTGRGRLLVSAAEGFFFMSGLLIGMVYKRRLTRGMAYIFRKMWKRAAQLYVGSIAATLLFTALAVYLNHPYIKDGLFSVINWRHIIYETVLLRYGYGWADFLDRFAILMLMAPFAFYLLARGKWYLLAIASFGAWALRGNNFTLSWQIIFMLGMVIGFYWFEINHWILSRPAKLRRRLKFSLYSVALFTFILSYASVFLLSHLNQHLLGDPGSLPMWLQHVTLKWNSANEYVWRYTQKWTMGPVRIALFLIWFSALYLIADKYYQSITARSRGIIELLGRNSLFVYIAHAFIVFGFKFFITAGTTFWQNFLITAAALAMLVGVTYIYKYFWPDKPRPHHTLAHNPEPTGFN